jgi:predicted transcriptional regulator
MRTTIEMKPEHRTALLALASRRGEKRFSVVLAEAIESFLQGEVEREKRRKTLLSLGGSFSKKEGDELRNKVRELRQSWQ